MPTKKATGKKPPLPKDIREFLLDTREKCTKANKLIWSGFVDKELKEALAAAGLTHEVIALLGKLKTRHARIKWEGVINANYGQMVNLYARAFDPATLVDLMFDH